MQLNRSVAAIFAIVTSCFPRSASAGETVDFSFQGGRRLLSWQHDGARAFIPDGAGPGERVPLVVFLHGVNANGRLHRWMRPGMDLRPVVEKLVRHRRIVPTVLAAPSETRDAAMGTSLWSDFDVGAFVADTAQAVGDRVQIDTGRVVLVGHSGAGCNSDGGILGAAKGPFSLLGLVAIDVCMDARTGSALALAPPTMGVEVFWQSQSWRRDVPAFKAALSVRPPGKRGGDLLQEFFHLGGNPHRTILPLALRKALPAFLAPQEESGDGNA